MKAIKHNGKNEEFVMEWNTFVASLSELNMKSTIRNINTDKKLSLPNRYQRLAGDRVNIAIATINFKNEDEKMIDFYILIHDMDDKLKNTDLRRCSL